MRHDKPWVELLRYALVASAMVVITLVLARGKWLTGLLLGVWLAFVLLRLKRGKRE